MDPVCVLFGRSSRGKWAGNESFLVTCTDPLAGGLIVRQSHQAEFSLRQVVRVEAVIFELRTKPQTVNLSLVCFDFDYHADDPRMDRAAVCPASHRAAASLAV